MAVCRTDLAFLIQKAGLSAASVVEAADGVLAVAVGCPEVPPRCCPILPVLKSRPTEGLTLPSQWRWKISAIAAFCACPFFSFPSLRSSPAFFFSPPGLRISVTGSFLVLFLLLFRNRVEGAEGGWGASCQREKESARMGSGERRELLRSSARSSLVHSERSDTLC